MNAELQNKFESIQKYYNAAMAEQTLFGGSGGMTEEELNAEIDRLRNNLYSMEKIVDPAIYAMSCAAFNVWTSALLQKRAKGEIDDQI